MNTLLVLVGIGIAAAVLYKQAERHKKETLKRMSKTDEAVAKARAAIVSEMAQGEKRVIKAVEDALAGQVGKIFTQEDLDNAVAAGKAQTTDELDTQDATKIDEVTAEITGITDDPDIEGPD